MNTTVDNSADGLSEGVGQQLEPSGSQNNPPLKPQGGQWSFRFNYADPSKVSVLITVNFAIPFSVAVELTSEMNQSQVDNLRGWLARVQAAMKQAGES